MSAALWPVPPPFMWSCVTCSTLLDLLNESLLLTDASPTCEQGLYVQIALARHIATDHPQSLPAAHDEDCLICLGYRSRVQDPGGMWAEHRARSLFLPDAFARRL
ncbi:hypothetical protein [Streptomyces beigongshangae]|uniref:hypothetical protein n=1 Tax=Streptomyces beigongshangae TaxID=2841597 RepID=UPI001C84BDE4|nr:hypothetical protein [Streptomyces sp. REN17]